MGISLGKKAGLVFGIISGETTPFAEFFARKMDITDVYLGCKDKGAALKLFAERRAISLENICYVGDDVNDLPALEIAGLSAAPASAHPSVLQHAQIQLLTQGGNGAVRELIDHILERHRSLS
jgi:3-deoxy-D-manno-octulosonate 8-phosphate phosphatase (KDO 8-P phosphatase)